MFRMLTDQSIIVISFYPAKCSWLGTFCYPGVCPGGVSSCNCSVGFEGEDCLNSESHVHVHVTVNASRAILSTNCIDGKFYYINFVSAF